MEICVNAGYSTSIQLELWVCTHCVYYSLQVRYAGMYTDATWPALSARTASRSFSMYGATAPSSCFPALSAVRHLFTHARVSPRYAKCSPRRALLPRCSAFLVRLHRRQRPHHPTRRPLSIQHQPHTPRRTRPPRSRTRRPLSTSTPTHLPLDAHFQLPIRQYPPLDSLAKADGPPLHRNHRYGNCCAEWGVGVEWGEGVVFCCGGDGDWGAAGCCYAEPCTETQCIRLAIVRVIAATE